MNQYRLISTCIILAAALSCASCGPDDSTKKTAPEVSVNAVRVSGASVPATLEVVGIVSAYQQADLRSRVTGLVTARLFKGGQAIKTGQLLYTIDPTTYRNDVANADAALAQARAALAQAQADMGRYSRLLKSEAIARQTYDQAVSTAKQASAVVAARETSLRLAQLNLSYTRITSPLDGQIDNPQVDVGSMVTAGQTMLGTASTLNPVYVNFSVPEAVFVSYTLQHAGTGAQPGKPPAMPVNILLPDGTPYSLTGQMETGARTIASTGTYSIQAVFENPSQVLLPGMNVRVKVVGGQLSGAILIPQRAIGDLLGRKYVYVVGPKNIVEQRMIDLGAVVGELQAVQKGLKDGDVVVSDGLQFIRPGAAVKVKLVPLVSSANG